MYLTPAIVGSEGEDSGGEADDVICDTGSEERAVSAVVQDHKDSNEQRAGDNCQCQREPPGCRPAQIHERPKHEVGAEGVHDLPGALPDRRFLVWCDDRLPPTGWNVLLDQGRSVQVRQGNRGRISEAMGIQPLMELMCV